MLSRRAFLAGGVATLAAGAVGVGALGPDRVLHKVGIRSSPDHRVAASGWTIEEGSLRSDHVDGAAGWAMSRPPGAGQLAGAIVCLHGRGNDHRYAFDAIHLHDVIASEGHRIGVASIDGAESYWHQREDGTDAGRLVLDDFVPLVRENLGVEKLAVLGWSMGGYGALLLAEQSSEAFAAVVASSPALWREASDAAPGAFDGEDDFDAHDVFAGRTALEPSRVRVDCGDGDPFIDASRAFVAALGPTVTSSFPDGYHDAAYWRWQAPHHVRFVAGRFAST
jgi:pimeloyl-ACP methyl ester carboxylesterase